MTSRLNLMVGGPKSLLPLDWQSAPGLWGAADRGAHFLMTHGVQPAFVVGDDDSLTLAERETIQAAYPDRLTLPTAKDDTDTQVLLREAIKRGADDYVLYAATGGRLDHALANLFLPVMPEFASVAKQIHLTDLTNWIDFLPAGEHLLRPRAGYDYLGLVTLTPVESMTITDAKYPLQSWSSTIPFSWASNEFVDDTPIMVSFETGMVAAIYSRDRVGQQTDN